MTHSRKQLCSSRLKFPFAMPATLSLGACTSMRQTDDTPSQAVVASYPVSITRHAAIHASLENVFDFVVAEDVLPKVLTGYGPLPAVTGTSDQSAPWDRPGAMRIVHLKDGSMVREQVTGFQRPDHFDYRIWEFTNPIISRLADHARGEWNFKETDGITHIDWTYTFYTRKRWSLWPLRVIVNILWRRYMDVCLEHSTALLEGT